MSNRDRPIFIVGSGRSGTTLLQRMLRSHPRISSPTGESHFIIPLYRNQNQFGDLSKVENVRRVIEEMHSISREFMEEDLQSLPYEPDVLAKTLVAMGATNIPKIITALFEKNMEGEGKARWLDKTPYYILHLDTILELFPTAQIIHIIRDGRDCALSMLQRKHDLKIFNIHHAAKIWSQFVDAGQEVGQNLSESTYHEVYYEDLLGDPKRAMKQVCTFLQEEYDEHVVNFEKSQDPNSKTPFLSRNIQSNNTKKWRKRMTPWQIRVFERDAGDILARHNYAIVTSTTRLPLGARVT